MPLCYAKHISSTGRASKTRRQIFNMDGIISMQTASKKMCACRDLRVRVCVCVCARATTLVSDRMGPYEHVCIYVGIPHQSWPQSSVCAPPYCMCAHVCMCLSQVNLKFRTSIHVNVMPIYRNRGAGSRCNSHLFSQRGSEMVFN